MNLFSKYALFVFCGLSIFSCNNEDPPLPDYTLFFESEAQGLESTASELNVELNFGRAIQTPVNILIGLTESGVVYGVDYSTEPAAENGLINLSVPAGSTNAKIVLKKDSKSILNGNETIKLTINQVGSPVLIGGTKESLISFGAITSSGSTLTLNGIAANESGPSAANAVFVDFSGNSQFPVLRSSWDLGFYSGADFKVKINNMTAATAIKLEYTDLASVTANDFDPNTLKVGQGQGNFDIIDDPIGDNILQGTAIASISATDAENKVYIINRAGGNANVAPVDELYKVRILRDGTDGYTLQYAKVNEATVKTVSVKKDAANNFQYVSLEQGEQVVVEPPKQKWDIVWGYHMFYTGSIPYGFSDLVFVNTLGGAKAAEVLTSEVSYEDYSSAHIATTRFSTSSSVIGSNWRVTSGEKVGVKTDRFYVIQDAMGNVYKLKFISFHANDGGTRGKPVIAYSLVKSAN